MSERSLAVVDTNVILRWLLNDHPVLSQKAGRFWQSVLDGTQAVYLAEAVVAECSFVLQHHYRVTREKIADLLGELTRIKGVGMDGKAVVQRAIGIYRAQRGLSFVDALVVGHALERSLAVVSYDTAVNNAAGKAP